jgi:hypothetical protein
VRVLFRRLIFPAKILQGEFRFRIRRISVD